MSTVPKFRYFMLINETKTENNGIFPFLKDTSQDILYDGSQKDAGAGVPAGTKGAQARLYDLSLFKLGSTTSSTPLVLGGCMTNSAFQATDPENEWNYTETSTDTVYGIYHEDKTFTVYPPPHTPGQDAAALPRNYHSMNGDAMNKFFVALGGLVSPEI